MIWVLVGAIGAAVVFNIAAMGDNLPARHLTKAEKQTVALQSAAYRKAQGEAFWAAARKSYPADWGLFIIPAVAALVVLLWIGG